MDKLIADRAVFGPFGGDGFVAEVAVPIFFPMAQGCVWFCPILVKASHNGGWEGLNQKDQWGGKWGGDAVADKDEGITDDES